MDTQGSSDPLGTAARGPAHWFLSSDERGNVDTVLDSRHPDSLGWTDGNCVTPLIHGSTYFRALHSAVSAAGPGDSLLFTDWRGDPDERLDGAGTEVGRMFADAAARGAEVRGLVWRSHLDRFRFSSAENRALGDEIDAAGGQCLLDQRVRVLGSHHQKLVVLRYRARPSDDVAFVGGIDLGYSRGDSEQHDGDEQALAMAAAYGSRPPWHDVQVELRGPAVGDVDCVFRERWEDPGALTRNPLSVMRDLLRGEPRQARPLRAQPRDPVPCGGTQVQLLRTYPSLRRGYPFARSGERSVARAYAKALRLARRLVYVEDQYLWSVEVGEVLAAALERAPELRMVIVIPACPDQDGRLATRPNQVGREPVLRRLREAGGDRVGIYALENRRGTPIYVHAKVCVVDDEWACVGSDNANRRSWTHDSELSAAFVDTIGTARNLRLTLAREHLGTRVDDVDLDDPRAWATAFQQSADALDAWHRTVPSGPRPAGQLRRYEQAPLGRWTRFWASIPYRAVFDPDGRSRSMRAAGRF
jgi:phosphatidylserine/phosphatidylglycerophosphate/cardiolipin synthase-like enzyme